MPNLTAVQLLTIRAAIIADPAASLMRTAGDAYGVWQWANAPSATMAWRTQVNGTEIYDTHRPVDYIARSVAERSAFDLMAEPIRRHDFTVAAKRNGVADIFSGNTNSNSRTLIFVMAQEPATNAQMALGGTNASVGSTPAMTETVTALKRNFADSVSQDEIGRVMT